MTARELIIATFTSHRVDHRDCDGLGLVFAVWLKLHTRPIVRVYDGKYTIECATEKDAKLLCSLFGGEVRAENVVGAIVDLTS